MDFNISFASIGIIPIQKAPIHIPIRISNVKTAYINVLSLIRLNNKYLRRFDNDAAPPGFCPFSIKYMLVFTLIFYYCFNPKHRAITVFASFIKPLFNISIVSLMLYLTTLINSSSSAVNLLTIKSSAL